MREDLKGRNLTFTEIAKLVGENWQNLSPAEKEPFETQAQTAKDRYNARLIEYKKTPSYKKYQDYLQDFKAKHAHQSQGTYLSH
jgi:ABC-type transporter MlaC component